ncbi:MAG: hypothetical protein A3D44_01540 [Candidatus Staskawiczbacteria bacterium RIFCSPHIGHO2_02_FULL_42_22]|uniref:Uncharacterized protein n=1 Tax=Candidatus Staskawiczbacteria bacterium RIFCSPHIGHO2_02_FULL_42_22 TaxID=1802207 RepID=A0A1G2HZH2_9BACT|nr:MAG: hypothetical protein A3D44_01540 [Candidatus Staskawiczbacteria bacterium RIFCSPHIGHO2_02_FULL_42_22]
MGPLGRAENSIKFLTQNLKKIAPRGLVIHSYFAIAFMHLAQAKTRWPARVRVHCRLGYLRIFWVGLYFPRNLTKDQDTPDFLAQIEQIFEATFLNLKFEIYNLKSI